MQLHACLLALRTGRPVKMAYLREESFAGGHVHRHPARMEYEHRADARTGGSRAVRARLMLDGGAYASTSTAVIANATTLALGPYAVPERRPARDRRVHQQPAVRGDARVRRGAGRGRLRGADGQARRGAGRWTRSRCGVRNALRDGGAMPTGQAVRGPVATVALLEALKDHPLPADRVDGATRDPRALPGSSVRRDATARRSGAASATPRGSRTSPSREGFDDPATARVRLTARDGRPVVEVHTAAAEVGQGVLGVQEQIARTELGVAEVDGPGGRHDDRLGGQRVGVAADVDGRRRGARGVRGGPDAGAGAGGSAGDAGALALRDGAVWRDGARVVDVVELVDGGAAPLEATKTYRHAPTFPLDPGDRAGRRARGLRVRRAPGGRRRRCRARSRARRRDDVRAGRRARASTPWPWRGSWRAGRSRASASRCPRRCCCDDGLVRTRSFGAYRIPTIVDAAPVDTIILELGDPAAPYGLRGVGEMPSISSTPAILAALRAATGHAVTHAPAYPEHLVVLDPEEEQQ